MTLPTHTDVKTALKEYDSKINEKKSRMFKRAGIIIGGFLVLGQATNILRREICIRELYREAATSSNISDSYKHYLTTRADELRGDSEALFQRDLFLPFHCLFSNIYDFNLKSR